MLFSNLHVSVFVILSPMLINFVVMLLIDGSELMDEEEEERRIDETEVLSFRLPARPPRAPVPSPRHHSSPT